MTYRSESKLDIDDELVVQVVTWPRLLGFIGTAADTGFGYIMAVRSLRLFFFSSRRRHTRFDCDWSSDVCSSDLCGECSRRRPRREQTLALHALRERNLGPSPDFGMHGRCLLLEGRTVKIAVAMSDRKSTRLNSSHSQISYAVFCLKKKKHDD